MVAGLVGKLDDYGKPAWIALMVVGFIVFWPVGLAILFFLIGSKRMKSWKHGRGVGRWHHPERANGCGWRGWGSQRTESSGNVAFDEYREETMRRLEEEQNEFRDFLDRLRAAKDKSEFDAFMADRRNRPATPPAPNEPSAPTQ